MPASNSTSFLSGLSAQWSPIGPRQGAAWSPIGPGWSPIGPGWSPIGPGWSPIGPGWSPIGPGQSPIGPGWSPIGPGQSPIGPGHAVPAPADTAVHPQALGPWEGIDPPWTYTSGATLQAQALRKSRAKTAEPADAMALDAQLPPPRDRHPDRHDLWRWAPDFRMMATSGELAARVQVHGRSVWLTGPQPNPGPATLLFALPADLGRVDWAEQVDAVLRAAVEREDRLPEILSQATTLWSFFESVCGVSLDRAPAYAELVLAAEDWALKLIMLLKHNVGARRPVELSSLVHPVIATPGHGSLPSGHATLAAFNTELLRLMLYGSGQPHRVAALDRVARRIAFNRVVAGVHFPVDSQAGYVLGRQLARALATLAGHRPALFRSRAAATVLRAPWRLHEQPAAALEADDVEPPARHEIPPLAPAPVVATLWQQAQTELARLRV
jgi:hypothetical protein